jgi:subtilisin family serine protease
LIRKLQGTSMASPQVAGIVATLLQARPQYNQEQVRAWLEETAANSRLYDPTTGTPSTDYTNYYALQGAPNRYLQTPFTSGFPYKFTGGISFSS